MISLLYTTFESLDAAKEMARDLITSKKAACVQVIPSINSFYEWEGNFCESSEFGVLIKTSCASKEAVIAYLKAHHPYDTPCILHTDVQSSPEFLSWVQTSCSSLN